MSIAEDKSLSGLSCLLVMLMLLSSLPGKALAAELRVAVASNFLGALKALSAEFEGQTGHQVKAISGSTGKLYAQIVNGAPYAVMLAADAERPRLLEQDGLAVPGTRYTYAVGQLALWTPASDLDDSQCRQSLSDASLRHLAIANPKTAPYGAAAKQALQALNKWQALESRLVRGENIGQAFRFVASGNAESGFVALPQIINSGIEADGCRWIVPPTLHAPLEQQAVLLKRAKGNAAALAFLNFLTSPEARSIIAAQGYSLPQ